MIAKRQRTTIRVGKRAQIVIPAPLRHELGIGEGSTLEATTDEFGRLVLTPVPSDPFERLRKAAAGLFEGIDPVEFQRKLRDEWDE